MSTREAKAKPTHRIRIWLNHPELNSIQWDTSAAGLSKVTALCTERGLPPLFIRVDIGGNMNLIQTSQIVNIQIIDLTRQGDG